MKCIRIIIKNLKNGAYIIANFISYLMLYKFTCFLINKSLGNKSLIIIHSYFNTFLLMQCVIKNGTNF